MAFLTFALLTLVIAGMGSLYGGWQAMGMPLFFLWPIILPHWWMNRQAQVWKSPPLSTDRWLAAEPRWRRRLRVGRLTFLLRFYPTLDAPVLVTPSELVITPLLFRLRVCWRAAS